MCWKCPSSPGCVNHSAIGRQILGGGEATSVRGVRQRAPSDGRIRRRIRDLAGLLAGLPLLVIGAGGCRSGPPLPDASRAGPTFSSELALAHLDRLEEIGPRRPGDAADGAARDYLARALEQGGLDTLRGAQSDPEASEADGPVDPVPLIARWDGPSSDSLLLVAPYDLSGGTVGLGDDGGAGAVLTVELARALVRSGAPYDVVVALAPVTHGTGSEGAPLPTRARALERAGERLMVALEAAGLAPERTRLAVVLSPDMRTDSRMARDLLSPPVPRELVWQVASRLGHTGLFAPTERWTSPVGLQTALRAAGLRQVLALVPSEAPLVVPAAAPAAPDGGPAAAEEPPGTRDAPPADPVERARGTLRAVGEVGYAGLVELLARLAQVDAFAP